MPRYLITSDLHIRLDNLSVSKMVLDQIEEFGVINHVEEVLILGDLFHTKAIIRSECQNMAFNFFKNTSLKFVILVGNHDFENANCNSHSLQCFKELKNVTIIDRPTINANGVFIPYTPDSVFIDAIPKIEKYGEKTLFCHQGFQGFSLNSKQPSDSEIKADFLKCFRQVFSGHYHIAQDKGNISYVGSPIQQNFGEAGDLKRMILWDSESNVKTDLICDCFPKFIIIDKKASQVLSETKDDILIPIKSHDHVRFDITGPKELLKQITKADLVQRYGLINNDVKLNRVQTEEEGFKVSVEETLDYHKMFEKWLMFQTTQMDKEKLIKLAMEYIDASI